MRYNYIAIEGNIGAGKTSLATMIAKEFNGRLILEQFQDNPFLVKFYQNQERYALPVELSFLSERYQQLKTELANQDLFHQFTISDYFLNKSVIFARKTLNAEEYQLFYKVFNVMNSNIPRPDLLVHLYRDTKHLQNNIRERGRDYEQNISDQYLESIQESYFEYIRQQKDLRILLLNVNELDFVSNPNHYKTISDAIFQDYPTGISFRNFRDI
jgi:deoxyguanosine kinase